MASALAHVMYAPIVCPNGTHDEILDAIYASLTGTTDYAGSTLTKPLTVAREGTTTAVYWSYFEGLSTVRGIIAGDGATSPPMRSPDTAVATTLYGACNKGSIGAYGTWGTSPVFAGSTFSSYWRAIPTGTGGVLRCFTSGETAWVTYATTASVYAFAWGSLWDPMTTVAPCGESTGTLNGMTTTGAMAAAFVTTAASAAPFAHSGTANLYHTMVWDGGAVATSESSDRDNVMATRGVNVRRTRNNGIANVMMASKVSGGGNADRWIGRAREVFYSIDMVHGQVLQVAGSDFGYGAGADPSSPNSAYVLKAA